MNEEIELLHKKIEAQDKIINTQALEIARLKDIIMNEIVDFCGQCPSNTECPEDECVLYRIEKNVYPEPIKEIPQ